MSIFYDQSIAVRLAGIGESLKSIDASLKALASVVSAEQQKEVDQLAERLDAQSKENTDAQKQST